MLNPTCGVYKGVALQQTNLVLGAFDSVMGGAGVNPCEHRGSTQKGLGGNASNATVVAVVGLKLPPLSL